MQNVPNIVRERLRAETVVASHPDADVLTAFAERSLPETERAVVLEHVARCGDCREVLALALPETEAVAPVRTTVRNPWLTWPTLRWAFVTAGMVAIVSFGVLQHQRKSGIATFVAKSQLHEVAVPETRAESKLEMQTDQTKRDQTQRERDKKASATTAADSFSAPSSAPNAAQTGSNEKAQPPQSSPATSVETHRTLVGSAVSGIVGTSVQHGPRAQTQQMQQQSQSQANEVAVVNTAPAVEARAKDETLGNKIPPSSEMVKVQAAQPALLDTEAQNQSAQLQVQSADGQPVSDDDALRVAKAKSAGTTGSSAGDSTASTSPATPQDLPLQAGGAGINGRSLTQLISLAPGVATRWTITSAGGLRRSVDQGTTWQDVDVNAANTLAYNPTGAEIASTTRAKKNSALKKTADQKAAPVFRTLTVIGTDVWVGGANGALYHSVDAGMQWTRVVPMSSGAPLVADVVGIEFSDSQHGKITTSTAEVWTTADEGQSWQKQ
jgi:hypothetical protein